MESLTIRAVSAGSARAMIAALWDFDAVTFQDAHGRYRVEVMLGSDREIVAVLNALERYVNERQSVAQIGLNGRQYAMLPEPSQSS